MGQIMRIIHQYDSKYVMVYSSQFLSNMTQYIGPGTQGDSAGMAGLKSTADFPNMTWFALSKIRKIQVH